MLVYDCDKPAQSIAWFEDNSKLGEEGGECYTWWEESVIGAGKSGPHQLWLGGDCLQFYPPQFD